MKRTISAVMIVAMMLVSIMAIVPVTASAADTPDGTAISSPEEFTGNMTAGGTFYLSADITLSSGFTSAFSGTFDGNGHTVTMQGGASLFSSIEGGTLKNITVKGTREINETTEFGGVATHIKDATLENVTADYDITVKGFEDFAGAVAGVSATVGGTTTFKNVTNDGDIKVLTNGNKENVYEKPFAGGLVGYTLEYADVTFINCTNNGAVQSSQTQVNVGGILAKECDSTVYFDGCKNSGVLMAKSDGSGGHAGLGGMIGFTSNCHQGAVYMKNCVNEGTLSESEGSVDCLHAGGMIGRGFNLRTLELNGCINNGAISTPSATPYGWAGVGGMVGCILTIGNWDKIDFCDIKLINCTNTAKLTGANPGGMIGGSFWQVSLETAKLTLEYCTNSGEIVGKDGGRAGGMICGFIKDSEVYISDITVKNCKNTGNISGASYSGGILGYMDYEEEYEPTFESCINTGKISALKSASGIVGSTASNNVINNCVNSGTIEGQLAAPILTAAGSATGSGNIYKTGSVTGTPAFGTTGSETEVNTKIEGIVTEKKGNSLDITRTINTALTLYKANYTAATWSVLETALAAAKTASADPAAEQTAIDAAKATLDEALTALVYVDADFTALDAELAKTEGLKRSDWTSSTWLALTKKIEEATALKAADGVVQYDVDTLTAELAKAIEELTAKDGGHTVKPIDPNATETDKVTNKSTEAPTTTEAPTATEAPTNPAEEEKSGCGSIVGGAVIVLAAVATVGAGIALKKKED